MTKRDDDKFCNAIHEASHCVTAHELGVPVYGVQIGLRRGYATIGGLRAIDAAWRRDNDWRAGNSRWVIDAHVQICLGGVVGQKIHDGSTWGCEGDWQMIDAVRQRFGVTDIRIKRLEKRTWKLLLDHWGTVIRLAARLLDAGSLDRAEIAAILER